MTEQSQRRALVVDDDTVSRLVLAHMLRRAGWEVVEAADLGPAVDLVSTGLFSVIFSDFSMPGGTGMDLLSALPDSMVKPLFVLVTGIVEFADGQSADGVAARLTKPISSRTLAACLATILPAGSDR